MAKKATTSRKRVGLKAKAVDEFTRVVVPVESVVQFVRMLDEQGLVDEFIKAAKRANATVTVRAESVDFVRKYLVKKSIRTAMRSAAVDPCQGDPFSCFRR